MASTTANPLDARTRPGRGSLTRARAALAEAARQGLKVASAARHRYRRPALVTSSFTCIDAGIWHTFGTGAGLVALGLLGLVLEMLGSDE
jgi:hypothetical protein